MTGNISLLSKKQRASAFFEESQYQEVNFSFYIFTKCPCFNRTGKQILREKELRVGGHLEDYILQHALLLWSADSEGRHHVTFATGIGGACDYVAQDAKNLNFGPRPMLSNGWCSLLKASEGWTMLPLGTSAASLAVIFLKTKQRK